MTEEEKKALEFFKDIIEEFKCCNSEYIIDKDDKYGILRYLKALLNLIQKQDTEIKKLNNVIDKLVEELRYDVGMGQLDLFCYDTCENRPKRKCTDEECAKHIKEYFMKEDK